MKLKEYKFAPHVKDWDFGRFEKVVKGYAKLDKIENPTSSDIEEAYEKVTGKKIKSTGSFNNKKDEK